MTNELTMSCSSSGSVKNTGGNTERFSDRLLLLGAQNSAPKFFPNN